MAQAGLEVTTDLIFHAAFSLVSPYDPALSLSREAPDESGAADRVPSGISPGQWHKPNCGWDLPLYPYMSGLCEELRGLLPRCVEEWSGKDYDAAAEATALAPAEGLDRPHPLQRPSVTLWEPPVLLVSQRLRTRLEADADAFVVIGKRAEQLHDRLTDAATRALGTLRATRDLTAEEDSKGLQSGEIPDDSAEPLWIVGTALPAPAGPRSSSLTEATDMRDARALGPLRVRIEELTTVVVSSDASAPASGQADVRSAADEFALLMAMQNVVWAAAVDYDRTLLRKLVKINVDISRRQLRGVEAEGGKLTALFHRVASFRAAVGSLETHLDRRSHALWMYMDESWDLTSCLNTLGEKVEDLRHLHNEVSAAVSSRRARRLGGAAWAFTALGVVTVGLTVVNFITEDVKGPSVGVLAGIVLTLLFGLVAFLTFRFGWAEKAEAERESFRRRAG